jgi:hypothetical protein
MQMRQANAMVDGDAFARIISVIRISGHNVRAGMRA